MGKYVILEPVVYQEGRKIRSVRKPTGDAVTIDDAEAKKLGDKVRPVGDTAPTTEPEAPKAEAPKPDTKPNDPAGKQPKA